MRRSTKYSLTGFAAIALAAASVHAQTLVYNFATLYDSSGNPDPSGTLPDDFTNNGSGTSISQSTVGVPAGSYSMQFEQTADATFTGALTELVPEIINDPNTTGITFDITIPTTGAFGGNFARIGISEFGDNESQGYEGIQVQTVSNSESNIDLPAGTYQFTIPLIAISNPLTGDTGVPFSNCFGSDPDTQMTPVSFEFYINKSATSPLNVYISNVEAIGPQTTGTWAESTGGSWSTTGNWIGGEPTVAMDSATFTNTNTGTATVTLDGDHSMGTLTFDSPNQYVITAGTGGTLTMDAGGQNISAITVSAGTHTIAAPVAFSTDTSITVSNPGSALNITGNVSGAGSLTVAGDGTVDLSGTNTYVGGTTVSSGTLVVGSNTSLPTENAVVNIASGATVKLAPGIGAVTIQLPNISAGGTLDINNDQVYVNYGTGADPINSIIAMIQSGYDGGSWAGTGITSSAAAANSGSYGVGYADAADPGNPANLPSGQIEIMYTLLGDANLDGKVNGADFAILATNFNQGGKVWDQGDFNYDGNVNGADFTLLAKNFNQSATQSAVGADDLAALDAFAAANGISLTSVPEPATVGLLAIGGLGILVRRRRTRS
jgi:autotransporter-associated beta strand protein